MEESGNITGHLISATYKVSPIPVSGLEVHVKRGSIFKLKKSFANDSYD